MANHADIKTKLPMTAIELQALFDELNKTHIKSLLTFDAGPAADPKDKTYFWEIYAGKQWIRQCWLNSPKSFTMRHGGGSTWDWWVDHLIVHTIAAKYDGIITDDGCGEREKGEPEKYATFKMFFQRYYRHITEQESPFKRVVGQKSVILIEKRMTPKLFRNEVTFKKEAKV